MAGKGEQTKGSMIIEPNMKDLRIFQRIIN